MTHYDEHDPDGVYNAPEPCKHENGFIHDPEQDNWWCYLCMNWLTPDEYSRWLADPTDDIPF